MQYYRSPRYGSMTGFIVFIALMFVVGSMPAQAVLPMTDTGESPFAAVYAKVAPAVVLIEVQTEQSTPDSTSRRLFERFFNVPNPNQQQRRMESGLGAGVIISREGDIVTNNHVVDSADRITVTIDRNMEYTATIVGTDPQTDLAVIRLDLGEELLPPERVAEFGDSDVLEPGDYAIAIGNPMGLERTITVGVISGLGRYNLQVAQRNGDQLRLQDFIQTDAQINPGNSGGALVNIDGQVVGINNMYAAQYAAIGFAIPSNLAKNVAEKLIEFGAVKRGFVGISTQETNIDQVTQESMGLPGRDGVLVDSVVPGSPADTAGLESGDFVLSINDVAVRNMNDFSLQIGQRTPGEKVTLQVFHDGTYRTVTIELADYDTYSTISATGNTPAWRGINVVDLGTPMAAQYNLDDITSGVVVVKIDEQSPAEGTNLSEGDVIVEVENKPVGNLQDFNQIRDNYRNSTNPILIQRLRTTANGRINRGYVAVPAE